MARNSVLILVVLALAITARPVSAQAAPAADSGERAAHQLEALKSLGTPSIRKLSGPEGTLPLGFYSEALFAPDGRFYLSAISGGIYPSERYRVMRFDATGAFLGGIGPLDPQAVPGGVGRLAGFDGSDLLVVSRWLGESTAAAPGWSLYRLSPDLKILRQSTISRPGILANEEIISLGPPTGMTRPEPGSEPPNCVHVYGLDDSLRRSFGPCPAEMMTSPLQTVVMDMSGGEIYWSHVASPEVRVSAIDGMEVARFGSAPASFVTMEQAFARAKALFREPSTIGLNDVVPFLTPVRSLVVTGGALLISFATTDERPDRFWAQGSIVQVYDLASRSLVEEFTFPGRLIGRDAAGHACWLVSDHAAGKTDHWLITTKVEIPAPAPAVPLPPSNPPAP